VNQRSLPLQDWTPRIAALLAVAAGVVVVWRGDAVAGGLTVLALAALARLVTRRGPGALRRVLSLLVVGAAGLAVVSGLVLAGPIRPLPATGPLLVDVPAAPQPDANPAATGPPATVLGFVAGDYGDAAGAIDRDGGSVSSIAATGLTLGTTPGTLSVFPSGDLPAQAHLHGDAALAVVSNYDGAQFNGERAAAVLRSAKARSRLVAALLAEVGRHRWDGIVLDFERLPTAARTDYPRFVADLGRAAGDRPVLVAVPARDPEVAAGPDGYDLAALGAAADQVVWMAYDQHTAAGGVPGPVAGLPWVARTLAAATAAIPPDKLLLGIAGYGYAWPAQGPGRDLTVADAQALAGRPGSTAEFDATEAEWRVHTADGTEAWYSDARSTAARAALAADHHLAGVALWRLGAQDPAALASLPFPVRHSSGILPGGGAEVVHATGVVALTFDDGPDPRFTDGVLSILRRQHVPATFFVIADQAQAHPDLVRREVHDGHIVANHTYSHIDLALVPKARAQAEILAGAAVVEGITGRKPALFRAPYGEGDDRVGTEGADAIAADLGLHPVRWNDDSWDWRRPGVDTIVDRVLAGASPRTVVLLHDGGGDRSETLAALPRIIDGLRQRGYAFTTVDRLQADMTGPYLSRTGAGSRARGLGIIAAFRLQLAARHVLLALLVVIVALSLWRILAGAALSVRHRTLARRRAGPAAIGPAASPVTFTVIVPAHNEERVIAKTLSALELARSPGVEVIVVDDGSRDATAEIAGSFPVRVISQARAGKAAALNTGIAAARGEVIVVLDADTVLDPDFLDAVAPHFADPSVGAVAGNVKVGNRRTLLARLQALEYIVSLDLDRRTQDVLGVVAVVPGAAGAFRRAALVDVGGFPAETLVEDADLTIALLRGRWRIHYEPAALSWTEAPETVGDVLRQRRRWAYGNVEVLAKHAPSLLRRSEGRVGVLGLPWMLLSQVFLPLSGPLSDAFLLYLLAVGRFGPAAAVLLVSLALDVAVTAAIVVAEKEDRRLLAAVPLQRLLWRPLTMLAVAGSSVRWVTGERVRWRRVRRRNSVVVPEAAPARTAP